MTGTRKTIIALTQARARDAETIKAAETLARRLADCISWMDTREKMVPGVPRICDQSREALNTFKESKRC